MSIGCGEPRTQTGTAVNKTHVLSPSESEAAGQTVEFVERGLHRDDLNQLCSQGLRMTATNPVGHQKLLSLSPKPELEG